MASIESKWQCNECRELHEWEDDAAECCRPSISEVYCCPICCDTHIRERDAFECCEHDPNEPEIHLSAIELERMGQLRLIP